jgi:hypothetical protein
MNMFCVPKYTVNNRKPLEQGISQLTREMSEVLVLSPLSRIYLSLNLSISSMSIF